MIQGLASTDSVENTDLGKKEAFGSIVPMSHVMKGVDWKKGDEIREFFQQRFDLSSLPYHERSKIYVDVMTVLSMWGLVFSIKAKGDRKKLRKGYDMDTIQSLLIPESEHKIGNC